MTALREQFSDIASVLINVNARRPMSSWVKRPSPSTARATSRILSAVCRSGSAPSPSIRSTHWPLSGSTASLPSTPSWSLGRSARPLLRHGHHRSLHGRPLPGAHRRGDRAEAIDSAKANAARMGDAVAVKSRFFCADAGQAAARLAAEGLRPDVIMLDPPRKLRRNDPFRRRPDVPPPGGLRQLQPLHRRKRCRMARRAWVSCGEGAAGGPFSTNTACGGCELLYQNDVTNATLKPLRSGSPFDQTPCRATHRSGRQHG